MTHDIPDDNDVILSGAIDPVQTTEAARILHVSAETVRSLERTGRLRALRTRNGVRIFDRPDVERIAKEREAAGR
jgi:excisionase family DNA binding protein